MNILTFYLAFRNIHEKFLEFLSLSFFNDFIIKKIYILQICKKHIS